LVTYNQGPQSSLLQFSDNPASPFVPTITIPATQNQLYNVQWAVVWGPFSAQAEWDASYVEQIGGGPVFLHGSYVYGSWFLTGEHREYVRKDGKFGGPKVRSPFLCMSGPRTLCCGPGAWELAARFAYLNFASPNLPLVNGLPQGNKLADV